MKKNRLQKGIRKYRFLKKSIFYQVTNRNIDIAFILTLAILIITNIDGKSTNNIIIHIPILLILIYLIFKYLQTWKQLNEYYSEQDKLNKLISKGNEDKNLSKVDADAIIEFLQKMTKEINQIKDRYLQKKDHYKDFNEYLKYDKIDFIETDELLNENKSTTYKTLLITLATISSVIHLREIPHHENNNFLRIVGIVILTIISLITKWFLS